MSDTVTLSHGGGGRATRKLIERVFAPAFQNDLLAPMADSAILPIAGGRIAFTTDSHVVQPLFFPGGDIGSLAINGTANDLAVMGARPGYITAGFIIEEGLSVEVLQRVVHSMQTAAREAGVTVVAGDTKVVNRGAADRLFITTAGVGELLPGAPPGPAAIREGDVIIVTGPIGDHGATIFAVREDPGLQHSMCSDCACVYPLVEAALSVKDAVRVMRDPTRGGLGMVLNEFVEGLPLSLELDEEAVPVRDGVRGVCEMMGFDPLYLACEGRAVMIVAGDQADAVLAALKALPAGREAAIVGRASAKYRGLVYMRTMMGGERMIDMPSGEMLPRIC